MQRILLYRDKTLYCHHSVDETPLQEDFSMHAHEMMEALYIVSGRGSYLVEGAQYVLRPRDLFIMRNAETHKLLIEPGEAYERIAIHFSPDLPFFSGEGRSLLRPFLDRPLGQLNQYRQEHFGGGHWESAFSSFDFGDSAEIQAHIASRLFLLLPALCDAFDRRRNAINRPVGAGAQLVAYVNEHLFEPLCVGALSRAFYCSDSQIMRLFRQATGSTLWQYVLLKRLLAARAMLQRGESAQNACAACGFSDYSSFYRAYKKRFGSAPKSDLT